MSQFMVRVEHIPTLGTQAVITRAGMEAKLKRLPIKWKRIKLDDHNFYAPMWADCIKIIDHLKPKIPAYLVDKFDCDNNADWWKVEVARIFKINTFARVDGWVMINGQRKRHGWTWFYDAASDLFYQLEGQTGEIMDFDDPGYVPDEIVMG